MGLLVGRSSFNAEGVTGNIKHGETITIAALGGENFGTKPDPDSRGTAKPVLVWRGSDNSLSPNSTLGDKSAFSTALSGTLVTSVKATNSTHSIWNDMGWDERKGYTFKYEFPLNYSSTYTFMRAQYNFDDDTGKHYRTRVSSGDIGLISQGDWGRSQAAPNATGRVAGTLAGGTDQISWDNNQGTISYLNEFEDFGGGTETIDVYATQGEAESGSGTILETFITSEGSATPFRVLNNKQNRFGLGSLQIPAANHNIYYSINDVSSPTPGAMSLENLSDPNYAKSLWTNGANAAFGYRKDEWYTQETRVSIGSVDTEDGIFIIYRDGVLAFTSTTKKFTLRETPDNTEPFDQQAQHGDDNGLSSGSGAYTDYVYYDDSLCRVIIADRADLGIDDATNTDAKQHQPCPIVSWVDQSIQCVVQQGEHASLIGKYIHVVDSTDTVISSRQIN